MVEQTVQDTRLRSRASASFSHDPWSKFMIDHRKALAIGIPLVIVQVFWWLYMILFGNFEDVFCSKIGDHNEPRYYIAIAMIFGSMVAGSTSEGGAAIAFPVLTLVMGVTPSVARDFSFMIQSVGMSCAAFTILFMNIKLEYYSIFYCSIGGTIGVIIGLEFVAPLLSPAFTKMIFVSVWFAFACLLLHHNVLFHSDKKVYHQIPYWRQGELFRCNVSCRRRAPEKDSRSNSLRLSDQVNINHDPEDVWFLREKANVVCNWKAAVLVVGGFIGGVFTSLGGSGLDICSFSMLTLLFGVSERIATPTSIILMAGNTLVAFLWVGASGSINSACWGMWMACIPVVVIGAPLGSILSSHWHRLVIALLVVAIDTAQLIGALLIVQPWSDKDTGKPVVLSLESLGLFLLGCVAFTILARHGDHLAEVYSKLPDEIRLDQEHKFAEVGSTGLTAEDMVKLGVDGSGSRTNNPLHVNRSKGDGFLRDHSVIEM
jgi:uncharacterized membrane protein YfcA